MPSAETIELIKVNSTIGKTSDLPISSTRSTLISKLKALLLRLTGTANITNVYGTAQAAELVATPNAPGAIATDGTDLYVCSYLSEPAKVFKIDLEQFSVVITLDLSSRVANLWACVIVQRNLYIVTDETPANLIKLDLDTFNEFTIAAILPLSQPNARSIVSDGTDLYIGTLAGGIIKVNIGTFTETATLAVNSVHSLEVDDVYLYALNRENPTRVTRILLSSFTIDSAIVLGGMFGLGSAVYGNYLYIASQLGVISKINLNTFSVVSTLTTSTGYFEPVLGIDGTYLIVVGTTGNASLTYIELANFTEYGIYAIPAINN